MASRKRRIASKRRAERPAVQGRMEKRRYRYYVRSYGQPFLSADENCVRLIWLRKDMYDSSIAMVDSAGRIVSSAPYLVSHWLGKKEVHKAGICGDAIIPKKYWVAEGL